MYAVGRREAAAATSPTDQWGRGPAASSVRSAAWSERASARWCWRRRRRRRAAPLYGSQPAAAAVAARPAEASDPEPWHAPMAEGHVNGGGQAATLEAHRPHRKTKSVSFHSATSLPTERKISSGEFLFAR